MMANNKITKYQIIVSYPQEIPKMNYFKIFASTRMVRKDMWTSFFAFCESLVMNKFLWVKLHTRTKKPR